jgi:hypothetical protein
MVFIVSVVAFVQARPDVPALPRISEFDGERAVAELKHVVSFRAQAARIPSPGTEPRVYRRRTPHCRCHSDFADHIVDEHSELLMHKKLSWHRSPSPCRPVRQARRLMAQLVVVASTGYLCRVDVTVVTPHLMAEFHLSEARVGQIFSSVLAGYTVLQAPSGWILA